MNVNDQEAERLASLKELSGGLDTRGLEYVERFTNSLSNSHLKCALDGTLLFPSVKHLVPDINSIMRVSYHRLYRGDGEFPKRFPYIFLALLRNIIFTNAGILVSFSTLERWGKSLEVWSISQLRLPIFSEENALVRNLVNPFSERIPGTVRLLDHCEHIIAKEIERFEIGQSFVFSLFNCLIRRLLLGRVSSGFDSLPNTLYSNALTVVMEHIRRCFTNDANCANEENINKIRANLYCATSADLVAIALCICLRSGMAYIVPQHKVTMDFLSFTANSFFNFSCDVFNFFNYGNCTPERLIRLFESMQILSSSSFSPATAGEGVAGRYFPNNETVTTPAEKRRKGELVFYSSVKVVSEFSDSDAAPVLPLHKCYRKMGFDVVERLGECLREVDKCNFAPMTELNGERPTSFSHSNLEYEVIVLHDD